jgi:hypothetical protein
METKKLLDVVCRGIRDGKFEEPWASLGNCWGITLTHGSGEIEIKAGGPAVGCSVRLFAPGMVFQKSGVTGASRSGSALCISFAPDEGGDGKESLRLDFNGAGGGSSQGISRGYAEKIAEAMGDGGVGAFDANATMGDGGFFYMKSGGDGSGGEMRIAGPGRATVSVSGVEGVECFPSSGLIVTGGSCRIEVPIIERPMDPKRESFKPLERAPAAPPEKTVARAEPPPAPRAERRGLFGRK